LREAGSASVTSCRRIVSGPSKRTSTEVLPALGRGDSTVISTPPTTLASTAGRYA
jgi:hypothetical protein